MFNYFDFVFGETFPVQTLCLLAAPSNAVELKQVKAEAMPSVHIRTAFHGG